MFEKGIARASVLEAGAASQRPLDRRGREIRQGDVLLALDARVRVMQAGGGRWQRKLQGAAGIAERAVRVDAGDEGLPAACERLRECERDGVLSEDLRVPLARRGGRQEEQEDEQD